MNPSSSRRSPVIRAAALSCFIALLVPERHTTALAAEPASAKTLATAGPGAIPSATEAPAAFDTQDNGLNSADLAKYAKALETFQETEDAAGGLGPVYNGTSCVSCHQNPVTGSSSQTAVMRAGRNIYRDPKAPELGMVFKEHPGGSLVHQRAIEASIQEHLTPDDEIRTLRMSSSILGDGYVECLGDADLIANRDSQLNTPFGDLRGTALLVPATIDLDHSQERVGRFGWKCQLASLQDFAADAYVNEMGVTSPLQPRENTADGNPVEIWDKDPENPDDPETPSHPLGEETELLALFMRATKAPPVDAVLMGSADARAGKLLFENNAKTGCAICHTPTWTTLPAGAPLAGFKDGVPAALGNKLIHPYSDFLLHNIGSGDGTVQVRHAPSPSRSSKNLESLNLNPLGINADKEQGLRVVRAMERFSALKSLSPDKKIQRAFDETRKSELFAEDLLETAPMIRTAPLWGLRTRPQLMHDGLSLTIEEAILRHGMQAEQVKLNYKNNLSAEERRQLLAFLKAL